MLSLLTKLLDIAVEWAALSTEFPARSASSPLLIRARRCITTSMCSRGSSTPGRTDRTTLLDVDPPERHHFLPSGPRLTTEQNDEPKMSTGPAETRGLRPEDVELDPDPADIRARGGALICGRRYCHVFTYSQCRRVPRSG